ncbi:atrial natriuretic peptide receptor 1-like [Paramacrobiotus metropolitanus]|uniref:atrial natriuretic peptide receptor 1-like n=1 Tax=Paramacrobiotus metropolitanus TaxID=2943436 RepID=UPI0024462FAB|nr:atrial natriuretic peptide receptor 1-like [Paramacrobiotus metropolitanus]
MRSHVKPSSISADISVDRKMFARFITVCVVTGVVQQSSSLNIIIVSIGDNPLYGYYAALPYFDVALQMVAEAYPALFVNYTRQVFHKPGLPDCGDAASAMYAVTGEIYDLLQNIQGFPLMMSSGCSLEMMTLGDFAREVNVPLLMSTGVDARLAIKKRYPTVLSFAPTSLGSQAPATVAFLKYYNWRTVTVFCDDITLYPPISAFLGIYCRSLKPLLSGNSGYEFYLESYDSRSNPDYEVRLQRAKSQSRVMIILTRADELRKMMLVAYRLNMTNSEYVFIHSIPNQGPDYLPLVVDMGSADDDVIFEAYKYIVAMTFVLPQYEKIEPFMKKVRETAKAVYSHTYTFDETHNELVLSIPEMILSVAKALNESAISLDEMSVQGFLNLFYNRTFYHESMRTVDIGPSGMRLGDTIFLRLNTTTRQFEPAWRFKARAQAILKTSPLADEWNGASEPPLNLPKCGYRNDRCGVVKITLNPIFVGAISGIIALFCILMGTAVYYIKSKTKQPNWWYLNTHLLEMLVHPSNTCGNSIHMARYNNEPVWLRCVHSKYIHHDDDETAHSGHETDLLDQSSTQKVFAQMRTLRHDNIARFYGVVFWDEAICVIWEGGRGTLRSFLTNETVMPDKTVQLFLIFNILRGVNYIHHHTPFRKHGNLSSLTVILDSRFTVKICDIATTKLTHFVLEKHVHLVDIAVVQPPEYENAKFFQNSAHVVGTVEADIFCLGIVLYEIIKEKIVATDKDYQLDAIKTVGEFHLEIKSIIEQCCSVYPKARPTIWNILARVSDYQPRGTVVSSLVSRLEKYADQLETTVIHRTEELMMEQRKVDLLLAEIIPPSLVSSLRNKVPVPAETFSCVTLYFSSMLGFDQFCKSQTPLEVGQFLNELYTALDKQISAFDVYKVETIKDGYVVVSGIPIRNGDQHALEIARMALSILHMCTTTKFKVHLPIRMGIHSGPIAAGFVGVKMPRYCLFGDAMNTASRMESHGEGSMIHVSPDTKLLLGAAPEFHLESRGISQIKGKGLMETFWLKARV